MKGRGANRAPILFLLWALQSAVYLQKAPGGANGGLVNLNKQSGKKLEIVAI